MPRQEENFESYSRDDDLRDLVPKIEDYCRAFFGDDPDQIKAHLQRCRRKACIWVDNQLESAQLSTFAKDNNKISIEASYAIYLVLRGVIRGERGEQNEWMVSFRDDAEKEIENLKLLSSAKQGLAAKSARFTRKRWMFPDYQAPDMVKKVPK